MPPVNYNTPYQNHQPQKTNLMYIAALLPVNTTDFEIMDKVCFVFGVRMVNLYDATRTEKVNDARNVTMALLNYKIGWSQIKIAIEFNRSRSSVSKSIKQADRLFYSHTWFRLRCFSLVDL